MTSGSGFTTRTGLVCCPPVLLCGLGSVRSVDRMYPLPFSPPLQHPPPLPPLSRGTESSRASSGPHTARQAGGTRPTAGVSTEATLLSVYSFSLSAICTLPTLPETLPSPRDSNPGESTATVPFTHVHLEKTQLVNHYPPLFVFSLLFTRLCASDRLFQEGKQNKVSSLFHCDASSCFCSCM